MYDPYTIALHRLNWIMSAIAAGYALIVGIVVMV